MEYSFTVENVSEVDFSRIASETNADVFRVGGLTFFRTEPLKHILRSDEIMIANENVSYFNYSNSFRFRASKNGVIGEIVFSSDRDKLIGYFVIKTEQPFAEIVAEYRAAVAFRRKLFVVVELPDPSEEKL